MSLSSTLPFAGFSTIHYQVGGHATYANTSDEVLMRCDQSLSDLREVIPTSDGIGCPSLQEVNVIALHFTPIFRHF